MSETDRLEALLDTNGEVRLTRHDAQEVVQKLRVRGGGGDTIERLESQLAHGDEVVLRREEAREVLDELRASGRRWVFGSETPPERPAAPEREPEPEPDPEPEAEPEQTHPAWQFWRSL